MKRITPITLPATVAVEPSKNGSLSLEKAGDTINNATKAEIYFFMIPGLALS